MTLTPTEARQNEQRVLRTQRQAQLQPAGALAHGAESDACGVHGHRIDVRQYRYRGRACASVVRGPLSMASKVTCRQTIFRPASGWTWSTPSSCDTGGGQPYNHISKSTWVPEGPVRTSNRSASRFTPSKPSPMPVLLGYVPDSTRSRSGMPRP